VQLRFVRFSYASQSKAFSTSGADMRDRILKAVRNKVLKADPKRWAQNAFRELYQVLTNIRSDKRILTSDSEDGVLKIGHMRGYKDWDWYLIRVNIHEETSIQIRVEGGRYVFGPEQEQDMITYLTSFLAALVEAREIYPL